MANLKVESLAVTRHPGASCDQFRPAGRSPSAGEGQDGRCALAGIHASESLCLHCLGDATGLFRARFAGQKAKRELAQRVNAGGVMFPCDRFRLEVDEGFCFECRRNPALQQILGQTSRTQRREPCIRRREQIGEVEVKCCGGKTRMMPAYRCEGHLEAKTDRDCSKCPEYQAQRRDASGIRPLSAAGGREEETRACASWDGLWQCHKGQTALILACGPSVLLPGEDPSPETVDPRGLVKPRRQNESSTQRRKDAEDTYRSVSFSRESSSGVPLRLGVSALDSAGLADVVISTNWAWKWYEEIIDYQVSYDPTPCLGWRPAHVKLLTPVRPKATMAALGGAHVYCFFPACDYGDIAQGKPLACSRNSGFAALAFAAYAGCSTIKVLGMDFGPRDGRMHFYHESDFDVNRRVKSFSRQKERVQVDLTKLLAAVRATGATVENLSPLAGLCWRS